MDRQRGENKTGARSFGTSSPETEHEAQHCHCATHKSVSWPAVCAGSGGLFGPSLPCNHVADIPIYPSFRNDELTGSRMSMMPKKRFLAPA